MEMVEKHTACAAQLRLRTTCLIGGSLMFCPIFMHADKMSRHRLRHNQSCFCVQTIFHEISTHADPVIISECFLLLGIYFDSFISHGNLKRETYNFLAFFAYNFIEICSNVWIIFLSTQIWSRLIKLKAAEWKRK